MYIYIYICILPRYESFPKNYIGYPATHAPPPPVRPRGPSTMLHIWARFDVRARAYLGPRLEQSGFWFFPFKNFKCLTGVKNRKSNLD